MASQFERLVKPESLDEARQQLARFSRELEHVDERIRTLVRERPVATLLVAAAAGHILGRLFSRW